MKKNTMRYIVVGIVFVLSVTLFVTSKWCGETFFVGIDELLFTLKAPLKGAETGIVQDGINNCLPYILISAVVYTVLAIICYKNKVSINLSIRIVKFKFSFNLINLIRKITVIVSLILLVASIIYTEIEFGIFQYIYNKMNPTTVYEDHYIHPDSVNIFADGDEKNLLCIYLESMEVTYASQDEGGAQTINYIPNLTQIVKDNISFSNNELLGGFKMVPGTGWTTGALLATTSGVPFAFPIEGSSMNLHEKFAPGLTTLGDVLEKFGYNQHFLCGSDADFGGRKQYFEQHGNYSITDVFKAREKGYIPQGYGVFWGYEDKYLYEIAKIEITEAYEAGKPFNYTMLTVDTHAIGGYKCSLCENSYKTELANIVSCADTQINDFLNWCKEQPFYEDTVIVIIGDHPRADTLLVENVNYRDRTMYNCFVNFDPKRSLNTRNRDFTPMDMFPTMLYAMGFEFDGNRIGLGTNMFSSKPTLAEELGYEYLDNELSKYSKYYIDNFS